MRKALLILLSVLFFIGSGSAVHAAVVNGNDEQTYENAIPGDAYLGGNTVTVKQPVLGELFAAAASVNIDGRGSRSMFLGGNTVKVTKGTDYNAYIAGSTVTLSGSYGHDVWVAGNEITIEDGTTITGELHIAGSTIKLAGTIGGNVFVYGDTVTSSAVIGGTLKGEMTTLTFTGGSIAKDLRYVSDKNAEGLDKVTVSGATERKTPQEVRPTAAQNRVRDFLYAFFGTMLLGILLILATPRLLREIPDLIKDNWGQGILLGLAAVLVVPVIALLAMLTIVGWKVVLVVMAFYVIMLILGGIIGTYFLGRTLVEQFKADQLSHPWVVLTVGTLLITILRFLPAGIGGFVSLVFFVFFVLPGIGMFLRWLGREVM